MRAGEAEPEQCPPRQGCGHGVEAVVAEPPFRGEPPFPLAALGAGGALGSKQHSPNHQVL